MSAKDRFHEIVRIALEKDRWNITHDPLSLKIAGIDLYIDFGAERMVAAEKFGQKIAIEIKSFLSQSLIREFHLALGQTLNYRTALRKKEPDRVLYLAISDDVYDEFFTNEFIQEAIAEHKLKLLIFSIETQEIVLWKE